MVTMVDTRTVAVTYPRPKPGKPIGPASVWRSRRIESPADERTGQVPPARVGLAHALGEPAPGPARDPRSAASSGHSEALGARRPLADLPDGPHRAGGLGRARDRDPRGGARGLQVVAPDAASSRAASGARARHPRPHLLQVRGGLARRLA